MNSTLSKVSATSKAQKNTAKVETPKFVKLSVAKEQRKIMRDELAEVTYDVLRRDAIGDGKKLVNRWNDEAEWYDVAWTAFSIAVKKCYEYITTGAETDICKMRYYVNKSHKVVVTFDTKPSISLHKKLTKKMHAQCVPSEGYYIIPNAMSAEDFTDAFFTEKQKKGIVMLVK